MAITLREKVGTCLLEVDVSGKLTHEDYWLFMPKVDQMVEAYGRIRLLFHMLDFHGWEASALWDDAIFVTRHFADLSRIAMVGNKAWEKEMSSFCRPFTRAQIRFFDGTEIDEARDWMAESVDEALGSTPGAAVRFH